MMEEKTKLSGFGLFTLWFGAAVSMAEIFTGGLLAPLGFSEGLKALAPKVSFRPSCQRVSPLVVMVHTFFHFSMCFNSLVGQL